MVATLAAKYQQSAPPREFPTKTSIMFADDTILKPNQVSFYFIVHTGPGPSIEEDTAGYFTDTPQRFFIAALFPFPGKHSAQ